MKFSVLFVALLMATVKLTSFNVTQNEKNNAGMDSSIVVSDPSEGTEENLEEIQSFTAHDIPKLETTGTADFAWPEIDGLLGTLSSTDLGITNMDLYWSHEQEYVDKENCGIMSYFSNPPGDFSGHSVIADHNYQLGRKFAIAEGDDQVTITTEEGEFIYQYVGKQYGMLQNKVTYFSSTALEDRGLNLDSTYTDDILMDNGEYIFSPLKKRNGNLLVFTCYPLNAEETNERLVIEFKMIKGVELKKD